jgi:glycosyltransferase involved in cell wall biosynthesis
MFASSRDGDARSAPTSLRSPKTTLLVGDDLRPPPKNKLEGFVVSHIIVTKDRPALLRTALEAFVAEIPANGEIIVVDGDPARSGEAVVKQFERQDSGSPIRYIARASGICNQRNTGIDAARGDVLIFTDDDCTPSVGFYEALASAYLDPEVIGATGRVLEPREERIGSDIEFPLRRMVLGGGRQGSMTSFGFRRPIVDVQTPRSIEYMFGTFMSARCSVAAEVRFDERLQRPSGYALCDDDDFSYRLSRKGLILYVPSAAVHHRALGKRATDRRAFDRRTVVSRTYLYRKNFAGTLRGKLGFAALIVMLLGHRILNREWQGVRGLVDGLCEVWRGSPSGGLGGTPLGAMSSHGLNGYVVSADRQHMCQDVGDTYLRESSCRQGPVSGRGARAGGTFG